MALREDELQETLFRIDSQLQLSGMGPLNPDELKNLYLRLRSQFEGGIPGGAPSQAFLRTRTPVTMSPGSSPSSTGGFLPDTFLFPQGGGRGGFGET